jgi:hypothetical protein
MRALSLVSQSICVKEQKTENETGTGYFSWRTGVLVGGSDAGYQVFMSGTVSTWGFVHCIEKNVADLPPEERGVTKVLGFGRTGA